MSRKAKPLPFKKGMKVVLLTRNYGSISLQEGVVSMVTTRDGETVVHTRTPDRWGGYYKHSFSPVAGMFQENPYPIWKLQPLDGKTIKNLEKRAKQANKLHQQHEDRYREISIQVESDAREWKYKELERRTKDLPNGGPFLQNVIARMGFKRPKVIKVKVNGQITTTRG